MLFSYAEVTYGHDPGTANTILALAVLVLIFGWQFNVAALIVVIIFIHSDRFIRLVALGTQKNNLSGRDLMLFV